MYPAAIGTSSAAPAFLKLSGSKYVTMLTSIIAGMQTKSTSCVSLRLVFSSRMPPFDRKNPLKSRMKKTMIVLTASWLTAGFPSQTDYE